MPLLAVDAKGSDTLSLALALNRASAVKARLASKLSSGLRIQDAADDPSGYAQATHLSTAVTSTDTASGDITSARDAESVTDGALGQAVQIVSRIRDLAVEASSDLVSPAEKADLQAEVQSLLGELNAIAAQTQYNGTSLFTPAAPLYPVLIEASSDTFTPPIPETSITLSLSAPPSAGNLLVVALAYGHGLGGGLPPPAITTPPGWTLVTSQNNSNDNGLSVYEHVAVGGDPASYTFTTTPGDYNSGAIVEIADASQTLPVALSAINVTYPPGSVSTPQVTAPQADELPLAFHQINGPANPGNAPTGTPGWSDLGSTYQTYHPFDVEAGPITSSGELLRNQYTWSAGSAGPGESAILLISPQISPAVTLSVQNGAAEGSTSLITIPGVDTNTLGLTNIDLTAGGGLVQNQSGTATTINGAQLAQLLCDQALTYLAGASATVGGAVVAIGEDLALNNVVSVETGAAASNIRDLNVAATVAAYTQASIVETAAKSVLTQANAGARLVLDLFRNTGGTAAVSGGFEHFG